MADESQSRCINEVLTFKQRVPAPAWPQPRLRAASHGTDPATSGQGWSPTGQPGLIWI